MGWETVEMETTNYTGNRRTELRARVIRHTKKVSARKIAEFVNDHPELFDAVRISASSIYRFCDRKEGTVSDRCLTVLDRYLEMPSQGESTPARQAKGLFAEVQAFFDIGLQAESVDKLRRAVAGMYKFYAYSERGREHVCRGAIEFMVAANGDLEVKEVQRAVPFGAAIAHNEVFTGHFTFGRNSLIAILRDDQEKHPKFYILSIPPYRNDDKQNMTMDGALLKIGAHQAVFIGNVHLVRSQTALKECTVMPRSKVDQEIIDYLDSDLWTARETGSGNSTRSLRRRRSAPVSGNNLQMGVGMEGPSLSGATERKD